MQWHDGVNVAVALLFLLVFIVVVVVIYRKYSDVLKLADKLPRVQSALIRFYNNVSHKDYVLVDTNNATPEESSKLLPGVADDSPHLQSVLAAALFAERVYKPGLTKEFRDKKCLTYETPPTERWDRSMLAIVGLYNQSDQLCEVLISIKGTDSLEDMIADISADRRCLAQFELDGEIHSIWIKHRPKGSFELETHVGFYDRATDAMVQIREQLKGKTLSPDCKILCTGHSLGGAVATLVSLALAHEHHATFAPKEQTHVWCMTYGAPRCIMGDASKRQQLVTNLESFLSADCFQKTLSITRVKNQHDPVPSLPLPEMGTSAALHVTATALVLCSTPDNPLKHIEARREELKETIMAADLIDKVAKVGLVLASLDKHLMKNYLGSLREIVGTRLNKMNTKRVPSPIFQHMADQADRATCASIFADPLWGFETSLPDEPETSTLDQIAINLSFKNVVMHVSRVKAEILDDLRHFRVWSHDKFVAAKLIKCPNPRQSPWVDA
jgi:hypothetical protein